jgi:hypothetical protein
VEAARETEVVVARLQHRSSTAVVLVFSSFLYRKTERNPSCALASFPLMTTGWPYSSSGAHASTGRFLPDAVNCEPRSESQRSASISSVRIVSPI